MTLATYLKQERGRATALARRLGVHISLVSMWGNGVRPVPLVYAFKIERYTGGIVRVGSLCPGVNVRRVGR